MWREENKKKAANKQEKARHKETKDINSFPSKKRLSLSLSLPLLIVAIPLCYKIFLKYFIQSQHNIKIQSIIQRFCYMFLIHQTILRPIFVIWMYIQCLRTLWDPILCARTLWNLIQCVHTLWVPIQCVRTFWDPIQCVLHYGIQFNACLHYRIQFYVCLHYGI